MTISIHAASVGVYKRMLTSVGNMLAKAEAHATARKIDPEAFLKARLAPDMYHLTRQVQVASDMSKGTCSRLAGVDAPRYEDTETTFPELKARVAKTIAYLDSLSEKDIDASGDRDIKLVLGPRTLEFKGLQYLLGFGTPNVYFHCTMVYAILRHNGVELGKGDFVGGP